MSLLAWVVGWDVFGERHDLLPHFHCHIEGNFIFICQLFGLGDFMIPVDVFVVTSSKRLPIMLR